MRKAGGKHFTAVILRTLPMVNLEFTGVKYFTAVKSHLDI